MVVSKTSEHFEILLIKTITSNCDITTSVRGEKLYIIKDLEKLYKDIKKLYGDI